MKPRILGTRNLTRYLGALAAICCLGLAVGAGPASAAFGIKSFDGTVNDSAGNTFTQAGGHPYDVTSPIVLNTKPAPAGPGKGLPFPDDNVRDMIVELPPGFVGNPTATLRCPQEQFAEQFGAACPRGSQVGTVTLAFSLVIPQTTVLSLYSLDPPPGVPAEFGFVVGNNYVRLTAGIRASDYGLDVNANGINQALALLSSDVKFWGTPADPAHDGERCAKSAKVDPTKECPAGITPKPFLALPTSCLGPQLTTLHADSWQNPGVFASASFLSHNNEVPPVPVGNTGCERVPFQPTVDTQPLSRQTEAPSGLNFEINVPTGGLENPDGVSQANVKDVELIFPPGMTVNASSAEGLGACSPAQIGLGTSAPAACPESSKIGSAEITTPLLEEKLKGSLYLAEQDNNPFHSTLALYLAAESKERGVTIKLPGNVITDEATGQIRTVFSNNPQLPFSNLSVKLKGGENAPLMTPAACGSYEITTRLTPWSGGAPVVRTSPFQVDGRCNTGGFSPGLDAGTTNPVGGSYSPFVVDVTRNDGELKLSGLDLTLPAGLTAKLAGVPLCPDAQAITGLCPAASQIGTVGAAVGAGTAPLWVPQPGKAPTAVYLAGPYKGGPYSIVATVPAQAGPFDLGVVAVRSALHVDPTTAQVTVNSDPFPQILKGIPIDYRRIHVQIDRPRFTLNPTNCEAKAVQSRIFAVNGRSATPQSRFQVGNCAALGFKPKLKIQLRGASGRLGHPALKAVVTYPKKGSYANIRRAQVNLPHAEFLDQGNLDKTCTKPVLMAGNCPKSSIYGKAKAWTPLLDKPLEGNVYLVGGYGYKLPALVADLNGQIRITLVGKVDSGKNKGIRNTFELVPDAPVSRFVLEMKGGRKYGLLENTEDLCKAKKSKRRAIVRFTGQNGKVRQWKPVVQNECGKGKKHKGHRHGKPKNGNGTKSHKLKSSSLVRRLGSW